MTSFLTAHSRRRLYSRRLLLSGIAGAAGVATAQRLGSREDVTLQLQRHYGNMPLLAISPDGERYCFLKEAQSDSFIAQLGNIFRTSAPPESELIVLDSPSDNQIFSAKWNGRISWASFFQGGDRLYMHVIRQQPGQPARLYHVDINLKTDAVEEHEDPELTYFIAINDGTIAGFADNNSAEGNSTLVELSIDDYATRTSIALPDGLLPGPTASLDRKFFMYVLDRHRLVVRRSSDLEMVWESNLSTERFPRGIADRSPSLSENGSFCAVSAAAEVRSHDSYRGAVTRVYDIESDELIAELPIYCPDGTAISEDGRLLAGGFPSTDAGTSERLVLVQLYDIVSGQLVGVAEHDRWRPTGRPGESLRLGFAREGIQITNGGTRLITSSYDTNVWSIM